MIRASLCYYSDVYIHFKGAITVPDTSIAAAPVNNTNKKVTFKNYSWFTNCISKVDHPQVDDALDIDQVMSMYYLIEYSGVYSKTPESLWQYNRDEPALDNNNNIINFSANNNNNNSMSFKFKQQKTG